MTASHPAWVAAGAQALEDDEIGWEYYPAHAADLVIAAVEPLIRADERSKVYRPDAHRMMLERDAARAEVAALAEKLAKCTDDKVAERVAFGKERNALKAEVAALSAERLEALQKVAALDDHLATLKRLDDADTAEIDRLKEAVALRAEVAALREQVENGEAIARGMVAQARREVLADLRDKVEELRDEAKADPVGSAVWRTTAYGAVLALIEEAQRG